LRLSQPAIRGKLRLSRIPELPKNCCPYMSPSVRLKPPPSPYVPPVTLTVTPEASSGFLVTTLMTVRIALSPHMIDPGPWITSMRSILSMPMTSSRSPVIGPVQLLLLMLWPSRRRTILSFV
jgi:hypothetical protein